MSFSRVAVLGLTGAMLCGPLAAQGIPRRASISGNRVVTSTRMMVATPYPTSSADSMLAINVAKGLRERMEKAAGRDYAVLADSTMNRALVQFGYHPDALLQPMLARQLAQSLNGRVVVVSTLSKGQGGQSQLQARLMGTNDEAGYTTTITMQPNEKPEDFGKRAADSLAPALKVYDEAKSCIDLNKTDPKKAKDQAEKALKEVPNDGLAAYCLALMAKSENAPAADVEKYLQMVTKGDPLSLAAWSQLASLHEAANDTAGVVNAYTEILRVAPGNPQLREQIFRYFLQIGRPQLAKQIAEQGLALDPYNADLYDLRSNACLFLGDFSCAVQSLEQAYQVDSTRADTLFFAKIGVAAEQRLSDTMPVPTAQDTTKFLQWSQRAVGKFPNNLTLLQQLNRAYAATGMVDSSLAVTQKILQLDSTSVGPAVAAVQALVTANRLDDAAPFIERVKQRGAPEDKERLAIVLLNAARPLLQQPNQNFEAAANLSRDAVALTDSTSRLYPNANLLLGYGALFQAATMDAGVEKGKACEPARKEQSLILEAEKAFTIAKAVNPDAANKQLETVAKFKPRGAALVKAYCR